LLLVGHLDVAVAPARLGDGHEAGLGANKPVLTSAYSGAPGWSSALMSSIRRYGRRNGRPWCGPTSYGRSRYRV
jgi:hypothetical protein